MRTLAIGDIHGFSGTLETLLDFVTLTPIIGDIDSYSGTLETLLGSVALAPDDRLIFLGDYIDRGPDSRGVLEKLTELSANPNHIFLRGNHDEWLLESRIYKRWFKSWLGEGVGGKATLRSYGAACFAQPMLELIPASHWDFLERTRLFFETDTHIFVHASISWKPPEFNTTDELLWPQFDGLNPHPSGKTIVCGHTSQPTGLPATKDHAICIDTFCSGQGWLSAFDVDSREVFQANEQGTTRSFTLDEI